ALYLAGIVGALVVALVLRNTLAKGAASGFIMEMPRYQMPRIRDLAIGLWHRAYVFLRRAGTIIFVVTIALWLMLSFPKAEPGESQLDASVAGLVADGLHPVLEPIGFNREMSLALIPAMAAREVAVSALATTYAVDAEDEDLAAEGVTDKIAALWTLPTALAFLAWFVFAPQCISTIAVARRETNGWKWPTFMVVYLFALAYAFAGLTFWIATAAGL
ncbi:MAG: nucleoside recognition domain-containing protein, partial [Pseudomonadota bacterium]|nr:nucleoside recognition domain-containing protein [Pseudomonadota bacterium]